MNDPAYFDRYSDMDEEETMSVDLSVEQYHRWMTSGRSINFFAAPEEMEASHKIESLQKMSASYQRRHGWPPSGLSFQHSKKL